MERVSKKILDRAAGRDIVIYGCGEAGEVMCKVLKSMRIKISFFVDKRYYLYDTCCGLAVKDNSVLSHEKYFVVIGPANIDAANSIKGDLHSQCGYDESDWFHWDMEVEHDIILNGLSIGKRSGIVGAFLMPNATKVFLSVGRYTSINPSLKVSFDHFVGLSTCHRVPNSQNTKVNRILIGNDVWIGADVFINASKVKMIGNGAIIGTGAVVVEDVPPYAVVAGVPARIKKYRFSPEQIKILEHVQWWNWDDETIQLNADCFSNPELFFSRFGH